ncbi:hypothetical protein D9M71_675400 [compost metagenome]
MVPHGLVAGGRDRKRHAGQCVLDGQATVERSGTGGILHAVVQHGLRHGHRAVGRIDTDVVTGVTLGQLDRGGRQQVLVLVDVLAIDNHKRLLIDKGVRAHAVARLEAGGRGRQPAAVGGNRTIGIAGHLGTDTGQAGAQFGRFLRRHGRLGLTGNDGRQGGGQHAIDESHLNSLHLLL